MCLAEFGGSDGTVPGAQAARGLEDSRDDPFLGEPGSRERLSRTASWNQPTLTDCLPGAGCRCPKGYPPLGRRT